VTNLDNNKSNNNINSTMKMQINIHTHKLKDNLHTVKSKCFNNKLKQHVVVAVVFVTCQVSNDKTAGEMKVQLCSQLQLSL